MRLLTRALLLTLMPVVAGCAREPAPHRVTFERAELPFDIPAGEEVELGYLRVPEVRARPDSRWIEVPVAILKSRSPNPSSDPLIHLIGGPGSSHLQSAKYGKYIPYLADRDYVVFEQRGSRYARPSLECPEWDQARERSFFAAGGAEERSARRIEAALACQERYAAEGIDLDGYRSTEIAADVEDFRKLMGYESYNLLAVSYGTKVAQVLLRDSPQALRSVILDSPLPLEVNYEEESLAHRGSVLARIFADCAAEPACAAAYPDLENRFWAAIAHYDASPRELLVSRPGNGSEVAVEITGRRLLEIVDVGATGELPSVPERADALARGEVDPFLPRFEEPSFESGYTMGLRLAVWCAEEVPFVDFERVAQANAAHPRLRGLSSVVVDPAVCEALALTPAPAVDNQPVRTEVPLLLVSGGYDAATPTSWAQQILRNAANGFLILFPQWGHTPTANWDTPCAQALVTEFLRDPSVRPDDACLQRVQKIPFVVPQPQQ